MREPRYVIGVDLGTSNCALAYVDSLQERAQVRSLGIPQLQSLQAIGESPAFPSFLYWGTEQETARARELLLGSYGYEGRLVPGRLARDRQYETPGRVIHSAKSWLVNSNVDREAAILPWQSNEVPVGERVSPVGASTLYLEYLRLVWNSIVPTDESERFEHQRIVVTVPASFDDVAQRLTMDAAREAGYPAETRLLEEPQAAFYYWLSAHERGATLREVLPQLNERAVTILVCDVGGGTTDFSLFEASKAKGEGIPEIQRIRVSKHLLLGGDNIDLAIAHLAADELREGPNELHISQWRHLVAQSRAIKERILAGNHLEEHVHLSVPGQGGGLFAEASTVSLSGNAVARTILEGFFPACPSSEQVREGETGLAEMGLPYAADPRITAHLASFLRSTPIDAVLFTGGSLQPSLLRERLTAVLTDWQGGRAPVVLDNPNLDLAVSRGAAWYGAVLRTGAGKIRAGYPRSVYLEVATPDEAKALVCIVPKGLEAGSEIELPGQSFRLRLNQPARFQLLLSNVREQDRPGDVVRPDGSDLFRLAPLETVLRKQPGLKLPASGMIDVQLRASLSETGMLHLALLHRGQERTFQWELHFRVRHAEPAEEARPVERATPALDRKKLESAEQLIAAIFGKPRKGEVAIKPGRLVSELERITGVKKSEWDLATLRALWRPLADGVTRRGRSIQHERTWLSLAGYCLRPGYGAEGDTVRMIQLWRAKELGLQFPKERSVQIQWWIMWRRTSGGLDRRQQEELYAAIAPNLRRRSEDPEVVRLAASLERINLAEKERLGTYLVDRIIDPATSTAELYYWALARVGAREPLYAPAHTVVPSSVIEHWYKQLRQLDWRVVGQGRLIHAFLQCARKSQEASANLDDALLSAIEQKLRESGADETALEALHEPVVRGEREQSVLFGESLPPGLVLFQQAA